MKKVFKIFLLLFCLSHWAWAEEASFTASATKSTVGTGEQFQVTFSVNANGRAFQAPAMSDFHILSGPNQSTSMQFINGNMSQSISFSYLVQPKAEGLFKIGPASIEVGGKRIQSNVITIKVVKGTAPAQGQAGGGKSGPDEAEIGKQIGKNLFLKVSVNKTNVTVGEEIIATYKIYSRVSLVNISDIKMPVLNGFWSQDVGQIKQLEFHRETIDGLPYDVADIKRVVLFPQQSGNLELDPMEGTTVVRVQGKRKRSSDDFFDQFFNDPFMGGAQDVQYKVRSNPTKITVKPLPSQGQPAGFGGAVGKFTFQAFLDKQETKTNESVNLKIKITGTGNLKLINAPKLNIPPDIESYDPKPTDNINVSTSGISGSRTFEYLLIPRHSGEFKIPAIAFSYYDLEKKSYVTINSADFVLKVAKGSGGEGAAIVSSGINKEDVQVLGKDIRFIKTNKVHFRKRGEYFYDSVLFYFLLGIPFFLLGIFIVFRRKYEEMTGNVALMKSRKATKMAKKRLHTAKKHLIAQDKEKFYEEVSRAMWGYVSDKLGIAVADLTKEAVMEKLINRHTDEQLVKEFINTLGECEFARYAPIGAVGSMDTMYQSAINIISKLEENIK